MSRGGGAWIKSPGSSHFFSARYWAKERSWVREWVAGNEVKVHCLLPWRMGTCRWLRLWWKLTQLSWEWLVDMESNLRCIWLLLMARSRWASEFVALLDWFACFCGFFIIFLGKYGWDFLGFCFIGFSGSWVGSVNAVGSVLFIYQYRCLESL